MFFKRCTNIGKATLYEGDTFEVMERLRDKSIDVICADLPYGTTKCAWDTPLDLEKLWNQYKRILKERGVILLFAQTPFDKVLGASNIKWMKYEWIWEKTQATGHFNAKNAPMKAHENVLVFYKNLPYYNPQKTTGHKPINSYTKKASVVNKTFCGFVQLGKSNLKSSFQHKSQIEKLLLMLALMPQLHKTDVTCWCGLLPQNLNWNANAFSFLFCAMANINLKN